MAIEFDHPEGHHPTARFIRAMRKKFSTQVIGRLSGVVPYLERTVLHENPLFSITIHRFRRNDVDVPHSHSFEFISLILRGAYREERFTQKDGSIVPTGEKWLRAGNLAFRRAETIHRVHVDGGEAWTLVLRGPKRREWFFCPESGPVLWWQFLGLEAPAPNATQRFLRKFSR